MKSWSLEESSVAYRIEFHFVDADGALLKSKTWELRREKNEVAKAMLLQANAALLGTEPVMKALGKNYVRISTSVSRIVGELTVTTFNGLSKPEAINQQIAAYPVTLGVVLDSGGVHISLLTAKPKH